MLFDVNFQLSIPGIPTSTLTRTVEADSVESALSKAKQDIVMIQVVSVVPNVSGDAVFTPVEALPFKV